jgi:hypothetical protein
VVYTIHLIMIPQWSYDDLAKIKKIRIKESADMRGQGTLTEGEGSTVDFLVLTSFDQLLLKLKTLFTFLQNEPP